MYRACTFLAALVFFSAPAHGQSTLTPESVLERIAKNGSRATVAQIYDDPKQWRAVRTGIAAGSRSWLEVAVQLRPGSDAGVTNQIELAVGEALEH